MAATVPDGSSSRQRYSLWAVAAVLVLATALLTVEAWFRHTELVHQHIQTLRWDADAAGEWIAVRTSAVRHDVARFAETHAGRLAHILTHPGDGAAMASLEADLQETFPHGTTVSLSAYADGDTSTRTPAIDFDRSGFQFLVTVPVDSGDGQTGLFALRFSSDTPSVWLATAATSRGPMFLLDRSGQVFGNDRPPQAELAIRQPVGGTPWTIAAMPSAGALERIRRQVWGSTAWTLMMLMLVGLVSLAALRQLGHSEMALRRTSTLQRAILDGTHIAIVSTDTGGLIRSFNAGAERMLGYTADEVIGTLTPAAFHDVHELALRADALSVELGRPVTAGFEALAADAQRRGVHERQWTGVRKDGSRFPMLLTITALRDSHRAAAGYLALAGDITERQRIDQMKKELISTVSHELRTPLTSIHGSLGLLAGGAAGVLPEKAVPLVDIAARNSARLVRLVNDVLDFQKIESGKMALDIRPTEIMPTVRQAITANRAYGEQFGVQFQLSHELPNVRVPMDADRITQVVDNLLSNAAKFSPPGDTVLVSVTRHNAAVRVSVTDHGAGIPETFQARIFEPFAQANGSTTREMGGTGLGLSICKRIITAHGGSIDFETGDDSTTFFVELPEHVEANVGRSLPVAGG